MKKGVVLFSVIFLVSALNCMGAVSSKEVPPVSRMIVEKDVPVLMRDGLKLAANVYRPDKPGKYPVLMGFTSHSKDGFWSSQASFPGTAYEPWSPTVTGGYVVPVVFEAEDPAYWIPHGYVLIIVDARGFGRSPGTITMPSILSSASLAVARYGVWARDMYDAIEWAGTQEWANGNVGLCGVSVFAFAQWRAAGLNPPHLKAIVPWEGNVGGERRAGGIPRRESQERVTPNPAWPAPAKEDPPAPVLKEESELLAEITVPALVCATWSDQLVHNPETFWGYQQISSKYKWLYTHGRDKQAEFDSAEAQTFRRMFYDYFLKGTDNRILSTPRVRMEVRETLDKYTVRWEDDFPVPRTQYKRLFLDAADKSLKFDMPRQENKVSYNSADGKVTFDFTFKEDTELSGYMSLGLWVSPEDADDMDIYATLRKIDRNSNEVKFDGIGTVAIGLLRLSYRQLNEEKSTPWAPYLKTCLGPGEKVKPHEIVPCKIPIWPSSTLFRKGEVLRLEISGASRAYRPGDTMNKGMHSIYVGGKYESSLLIPVVPPKAN